MAALSDAPDKDCCYTLPNGDCVSVICSLHAGGTMPEYPVETLEEDYDDGTMPANIYALGEAVIGRRIVYVGKERVPGRWYGETEATVITLDNGQRVALADTNDCCAYTELEEFFLHPEAVDHMILGVGTTEGYTTWHIYADFGDVMKLKVGWSCGNPFYYGYGFEISVLDAPEQSNEEACALTEHSDGT